MTLGRFLLLICILSVLFAVYSQTAAGFPASSFTKNGDDWYDNWDIYRTYYAGPRGFLPNLATETIDENRELAFSIGQNFQANYPLSSDRAVAILKYVQTWTEYGYDSDNVVRDGTYQEEWAWNADEMAHAFDETRGTVAIGDCEDMAFLCGTMYV